LLKCSMSMMLPSSSMLTSGSLPNFSTCHTTLPSHPTHAAIQLDPVSQLTPIQLYAAKSKPIFTNFPNHSNAIVFGSNRIPQGFLFYFLPLLVNISMLLFVVARVCRCPDFCRQTDHLQPVSYSFQHH
jgi:hypothetical protein